ELHGNLARVKCTGCARREDRGPEPLPELPRCADCGALLRPDIVWFHEMLPEDVWQQALMAAAACQCFLVVGTSAIVYPAAGLIELPRQRGAGVLEVNLERTAASLNAALGLSGPSGQLLPRLVEILNTA